jgi:inosine-uridine nucleoside N-ribohydrolase
MSKVIAEHNVRMDIPAAQVVFRTQWTHGLSFTPVDSSGLVRLEGAKYGKLVACNTPGIKALMENYRMWLETTGKIPRGSEILASSILFDTVAIYMAYSTKLLIMEQLPILITDDGFTVIDSNGNAPLVDVATGWKNLSAFNHMLVERLQGTISKM